MGEDDYTLTLPMTNIRNLELEGQWIDVVRSQRWAHRGMSCVVGINREVGDKGSPGWAVGGVVGVA